MKFDDSFKALLSGLGYKVRESVSKDGTTSNQVTTNSGKHKLSEEALSKLHDKYDGYDGQVKPMQVLVDSLEGVLKQLQGLKIDLNKPVNHELIEKLASEKDEAEMVLLYVIPFIIAKSKQHFIPRAKTYQKAVELNIDLKKLSNSVKSDLTSLQKYTKAMADPINSRITEAFKFVDLANSAISKLRKMKKILLEYKPLLKTIKDKKDVKFPDSVLNKLIGDIDSTITPYEEGGYEYERNLKSYCDNLVMSYDLKQGTDAFYRNLEKLNQYAIGMINAYDKVENLSEEELMKDIEADSKEQHIYFEYCSAYDNGFNYFVDYNANLLVQQLKSMYKISSDKSNQFISDLSDYMKQKYRSISASN